MVCLQRDHGRVEDKTNGFALWVYACAAQTTFRNKRAPVLLCNLLLSSLAGVALILEQFDLECYLLPSQ